MRSWIFLTLLLTHLLAARWVSAQTTPEAKTKSRTDAFGDPLPADALARLGTMRFHQGETLQALAYSPDGKTLASGSQSSLRVWDSATGKPLRRYQTDRPFSLQIRAMAYVPNSGILAWVDGSQVTFWNPATGKVLRRFRTAYDDTSLAFTPDGKFLVTAGRGIRLWDTVTGKKIRDFSNPRSDVSGMAITPDGKTLAAILASAEGSSLLVWDLATGKELRTLALVSGHALAFFPDGKTLAVGSFGTVQCWDWEHGKIVHVLKGHTREVRCLAVSPDRKTLAANCGDFKELILLWDTTTGKKLHSLEVGVVQALVFAPDGKTLAVGSRNGAIRLWDVATGRERFLERGHQNPIQALAFSANGQTLASVANERSVRLWEPTTGREVQQLKGHRSAVSAVAFHPDGKLLASAGLHDFIRFWRVPDGTPVFQVGEEGHGSTSALAFSPHGKTLASGHSNLVQRWEIRSGAKPKQLEGHPGSSGFIAYSPDGRWLASTTVGGFNKEPVLCVRDAVSGKQLHGFTDDSVFPAAAFSNAVFAADGRLLIACTCYGHLLCWELATGKPRPLFGEEHSGSYVLAISADGRTLATAEVFGRIHLWEVATGKERSCFAGHAESITALTFSADGRMLASGYADSSTLVWDLTGWQRQPPRKHLSAQEVQTLWQDLHKPAFSTQTLWKLVASPKSVVPFLRENLRPIPPVSALRFRQLLADLGSVQFAVRHKATRELEQLAEVAVPALRRALQEPLALETRRRVERILAKQTWESAPDQLRMLRTLEVLEQQNTAEARLLLKELSEGEPEARLSQQAKCSLVRLAKRSALP